MSLLHWNQRFFTSTRGRIVLLLRRAGQTVEELAQALNLTDNAIRAHLATLERDGFVRQHGERRSGGKPAYVYQLSPDAEQLFPKAYGPTLRQLLEILNEDMTADEVESLMRRTGQRLAKRWHLPAGDLCSRLQKAIEVLNELGGLAELEQRDDMYYIHGYSCPLAAVLPGHPEVCSLAETLLTELVGKPIQECCGGSEEAQCCFKVSTT